MDDRDDDLADAVRELARTIDELRAELEPRRRRPPLRPPTPGEALRVADEVAIPAALAVLRANVRALEAFQRGIELVRAEEAARDRTTAAAAGTGRRAADLRETTLSQLDAALAELQRAVSGEPTDDRARDLLEEARRLRDEVDRRLGEATEDRAVDAGDATSERRIEIDIDDGSEAVDSDDGKGANVDVDAELETLKDRYGRDEDDRDEEATDGDGDGRSGPDDPDGGSDRDDPRD